MTRRHIFKASMLVLLACYFAVGCLLTWQQERFIFPQTVNVLNAATLDKSAYTTLAMPDGVRLSGVVFPATAPHAPLVLAFGGNAHDVTGLVHYLHAIYQDRASVAGFSYRGYPNNAGFTSEGTPSEHALFADALTQYDTFIAQLSPTTVVAVGYSLGTAVATHVAAQRPISQLALVTPFTSMVAMGQHRYPLYPVGLLLRHRLEVAKVLPQLASTTIHLLVAEHDGLIPPNHAPILRQAAGVHLGQYATAPATHGTIFDAPEAVTFLEKLLP
ncbi:MAG: alpha/beta hydrolase [Alphaproteobacteria bacterium]